MRIWFVSLGAALAFGQVSSTTGAIQGTVVDPQRAPVTGAEVRVAHEDTSEARQVATRADGSYVLTFSRSALTR